jgi:hypothetical protein
LFARLERQVDPDGQLAPGERVVLVRAAARQLSAQLNAAKARRRNGGTLARRPLGHPLCTLK